MDHLSVLPPVAGSETTATVIFTFTLSDKVNNVFGHFIVYLTQLLAPYRSLDEFLASVEFILWIYWNEVSEMSELVEVVTRGSDVQCGSPAPTLRNDLMLCRDSGMETVQNQIKIIKNFKLWSQSNLLIQEEDRVSSSQAYEFLLNLLSENGPIYQRLWGFLVRK